MRKRSYGVGSGRSAARAVLALLPLSLAIASCEGGERADARLERDDARLLEPIATYDVAHADVMEHAYRVSVLGLEDLSRALPPMTAPPEPETAGAPVAEAARHDARAGAETDEEMPAADKTGAAQGEPGSKAKGAPAASPSDDEASFPTGPRGTRAPRSATEAAEREGSPDRPRDAPTPARPAPSRVDDTPEAVSPTAPAETAPLR